MLSKYEKDLLKLNEEKQLRFLDSCEDCVLDFSSNDYLGLSRNKDVINAGYKAALKYGAGSTGSRLISGNKNIFKEFEEIIAKDKKMDESLIFNTGYQANFGVMDCLADKNTVVIFDKLNHASLYKGVFSSGAKLERYNHLDYFELEALLKKNESKDKIIVSETVFGMDGDIADVSILSYLSKKYSAILYLDEAHATGLYGTHGYGISTNFDLNKEKTVIMGTFSKSLGVSGGYVACSSLLKKYLINMCSSFIYSTANSPFCVGAAKYSWEKVKFMEEERDKIFYLSDILREKLRNLQYDVTGDKTNIVPIIFDNVSDMLHTRDKLRKNKIIVSGIRRPTSPTPRIRIAINALHCYEDIEKVCEVLSLNESQ